ncbi:MAG: cation diffusion facilitator family transporter [Alkalilacustris sp.]
MPPRPFASEEALLRLSIAATLTVAGAGIVVGLLTGSFSITFDGIYSLLDAVMSGISLMVVGLIKAYAARGMANKRLERRFSYGFWHLEPIVLGLNGILLTAVAVYALVNAVAILLDGGRLLAFDMALIYAGAATVVCLGVGWIGLRANRRIGSAFVALDARGWIMGGGISGALVVAFGIALLIEDTEVAWLLPYVDPVALALVCLVVIPLPFATIRTAFADILLVTPEDLRRHIDGVAGAVVARHGFVGFRAYVARIGRARQIELYFIVPPGWPARTLEEWDALRDEIGAEIDGEGPDRWLTIVFTTDRDWAE